MSSRISALESPKASGDALEAHLIQSIDALEYVGDRTATWHDARTTTLLEPAESLPFYGIVVVEPGVPVEIKGCQIETSNGSGSTRGRFYVKREAHSRLLEAGGMYLFVVYIPRPGLPQGLDVRRIYFPNMNTNASRPCSYSAGFHRDGRGVRPDRPPSASLFITDHRVSDRKNLGFVARVHEHGPKPDARIGSNPNRRG
ncbi:hypothetical protein [Natrarchaeobius chitinivorans]|uniref:hypothetical protein n=1 Tax=Natrarchaeobius chitinivorans TaxID=1679083 RepID=UPI001FB2FA09|nr:hypothetical protein [Natrarchaeobius chitinivorans]